MKARFRELPDGEMLGVLLTNAEDARYLAEGRVTGARPSLTNRSTSAVIKHKGGKLTYHKGNEKNLALLCSMLGWDPAILHGAHQRKLFAREPSPEPTSKQDAWTAIVDDLRSLAKRIDAQAARETAVKHASASHLEALETRNERQRIQRGWATKLRTMAMSARGMALTDEGTRT